MVDRSKPLTHVAFIDTVQVDPVARKLNSNMSGELLSGLLNTALLLSDVDVHVSRSIVMMGLHISHIAI